MNLGSVYKVCCGWLLTFMALLSELLSPALSRLPDAVVISGLEDQHAVFVAVQSRPALA